MQDNYILLVLVLNDLFLVTTVPGWSTWFLLCDVMHLLHYTLMTLYDYCPIEEMCDMQGNLGDPGPVLLSI